MVSFPSTPSSILEESTPDELSEQECADNDTRATSVTTDLRTKRASASSAKLKPKTVFRLAHPPPVSIHKQHLHIRPRVLLQLQKVSETARPTPVLEVLPSFVFASRLARRFPRTFKGKAGLGADDLVIVSSENYQKDGSEAGDFDGIFEGDKWDKREIVAAICQPGKDEVESQGKAEICLNSGQSWTASRLASGAYELLSVDEHGLRTVARWVPKQSRGSQRASTMGSDRSTSSQEKKFNFSLLNPNSRRHAIIASLDRHSIEVSDQYTDPNTPRADPTSSATTTSTSFTSEECPAKDPVDVSQSLRSLIIVTGIYVAFQEGFSSHFKRSDIAPASPNLSSRHQRRSMSVTSSQFGSDQSLSPAKSTFGNVHRPRPGLQHSPSSPAVPLSPSNSRQAKPTRRSISTSTAFMQRIKTRNTSAAKDNQLSPVGDFESSDPERTPTKRDVDSISQGSTRSRAASSRSGEGPPLETVPSSGLDTPAEGSVLVQGGAKRAGRLERMFRRTNGVPRT